MTENGPIASFDRTSPVLAYWLANCEGFRVRADGRSGVVTDVEVGPSGQVSELVVSFGRGRRTVVAAADVQAVVPAEGVLVLGGALAQPRPQRFEPAVRRAAGAGRTRLVATRRASRRAGAVTGDGAKRDGAATGRTAAVTARATGRGATGLARTTKRETVSFLGWLSPRMLAAGRAVSAGADRFSARVVAGIDALVRWTRTEAWPAAHRFVSQVGGAAAHARERARRAPSAGDERPHDEPDSSESQRAA